MSVSLQGSAVARAQAALDAALSSFSPAEQAQARAGVWTAFEAPTGAVAGLFDPSLDSRKFAVISARNALQQVVAQAAGDAAAAPPEVNPIESTATGQGPVTWIPEVTIVGQKVPEGGSDMPVTLIAIAATAGVLFLLNRSKA